MKKSLKILVVGLFAFFIVLQFFRPAQNNPPVIETETLEFGSGVSEDVAALLTRSCSDCHTNKTVYPWYSKISPANRFLATHIEEGRAELNFSVWNTYDARRKSRKLKQICEQITDGEMPLPSYTWIHGDARLSEGDIKTLCDWTIAEREKTLQTQ